MNVRDHWFSIHNCLEYFFWFKSRLHFHARVGMIPLGGNTVFMRRDLVARVGGWDERCLTEDADIGLRLSRLGERIRVVYDARHVTREETPHSVGALIRQRTRWHQGYIQVLRKDAWRALPRLGQRLLAAYTLSHPILQAALMVLWLATFSEVIFLRLPVPVVMLAFLPLYALVFQFLTNLAGAYVFSREFGLRMPLHLPLTMAVTFLPFQWLLGLSAMRAVGRELRNRQNWEKTAHLGAHRLRPTPIPAMATLAGRFERLIDEACGRLGADRASVMLLDHTDTSFSILASRGLPAAVTEAASIPRDQGVAGWVASTGQPAVINGHMTPRALRVRLRQPHLRSSVVIPIEGHGRTIGVLSVASEGTTLGAEAAQWLADRARRVVGDGRPTRASGNEQRIPGEIA